MKSSFTQPTKEEKPFPKLMQGVNTRVIVLFSEPEKGMVMTTGPSSLHIGQFVTNWGMALFQDYSGSVTLSN